MVKVELVFDKHINKATGHKAKSGFKNKTKARLSTVYHLFKIHTLT